MSEYGRFCPVSMGSEVIADRWTPIILRELIMGGTRFNDIARGLPGISRSLLTQRLRHLERKGGLERWPSTNGRGTEYRLTPAGKDLETVVMAMGRWAVEWLFHDMRPDDVDAVTLTWYMHHRVDVDNLPPGRVVIQFDHTRPHRQSIWLVLERGTASVCRQHPGFETDVLVTCPTDTLALVFSGVRSWSQAVTGGVITVAGPPRFARAFPRWFLWSPFVNEVRVAARRADGAATGELTALVSPAS